VKCVPGTNGIKIVGERFSGVRSRAAGDECEDEQGASRAALIFWNESLIAENMKNQETGSISLSGGLLPRSVDDQDQPVEIRIRDLCSEAICGTGESGFPETKAIAC
jgi:hypothetical protein